MLKRAITILLLSCSGVFATTFTYNVAVNTTTLTGTAGSLYFQFNPGGADADAATATLSNFSGALLVGSPFFSGGASGGLGSSLNIANSVANNDALQSVVFGTSLAFRLTLAENFSGTASTGSVFNFGLYGSDGITPLLTTQADGYSVIVDLDTLNRATAQNTTAAATVTSAPNAVPEPATLFGLGAGLAVLIYTKRLNAKFSSLREPSSGRSAMPPLRGR